MSLLHKSFLENCNYTDKATWHSYGYFYEPLFKLMKNRVKNFLEIGINTGGSLEVFSKYFPNAEIHGIDIEIRFNRNLGNNVFTHLGNAYDENFLQKFIDKRWDVVLDDGPHTKESQAFTLNYFENKLADDGIILVEDVEERNIDWIINNFHGNKNKLSVVNRKHAMPSINHYNNEFILIYI